MRCIYAGRFKVKKTMGRFRFRFIPMRHYSFNIIGINSIRVELVCLSS